MGRTRKLLPAKAGKRLRSLEYGNEMGVFIKIGLRTASAAAESLHYVSGLPVPSLNRVRCGGIPSRWEGPVSCYLPKQVRDCGAWNMEMKWGSLLKSGSGLRPPRRNRATAPGPICSASGSLIRALHRVCRKHRARESLHYVWGLPVPSLKRVRPLRSPITMGRTRKLLPAKAGKRLRSLEYGNEMGVFITIGLRSRATATRPICSASGSLIRALHRVCRKHRARESLHYVSGLPVPFLNRVRYGGSPKRAPSHLRSFRIPS